MPREPSAAARQHAASSALREVATPRRDWSHLRGLPWGVPLEEWPEHGVTPLTVRRGEARHPILFVDLSHHRYAIKETSPAAAEHEVHLFQELRRRGCPTLEPVGHIVTAGEPVPAGEVAGRTVYVSGDAGYCVTRLAEHVLPQSVLYRYPFTDQNKRLLWNAIADLLLQLHEAGVFWGDPSLANVLIDLSGHRLTAIMADAETAEVVQGHLAEGLRRQDLDAFVESLEWQAEDIRLARGLPEDDQLVTQDDANYFLARYAGLRAERAISALDEGAFARLRTLRMRMERLNALGYGMLALGTRAVRAGLSEVESAVATPADEIRWRAATLRPGWYVQRLRELLGVRVPRAYASRIYEHILVHKWLMSEHAGHDVGLDAAARDWLTHIHRPAMEFLNSYLPSADPQTLYAEYLRILDHMWDLSQREGRPVSFEEGGMDYALARAEPDPTRP
jgi:Domain of unknown function (DUF4032)